MTGFYSHLYGRELQIRYSVSYEWQAQVPIAFPISSNFLTEQNHKIERISDLVVVIKKLTKTTEDATFRRRTEVAGTSRWSCMIFTRSKSKPAMRRWIGCMP